MASAELALPAPFQTSCAADFAAIGLWATEQHSELVRLTTELRSLQVATGAATDRPELETDDAGPTSTTFAPVIDLMLEAAMEQLDARADAAREEATAVVAAAMREATVLLMSVGADAATVHRVTTGDPGVEPVLRRPRGAAELWRDAEPSRRGSKIDVAVTPHPGMSTSPSSPSFNGDGGVAGRDASQVYELFWGTAPSDRPVRERLRRFGQRSQP